MVSIRGFFFVSQMLLVLESQKKKKTSHHHWGCHFPPPGGPTAGVSFGVIFAGFFPRLQICPLYIFGNKATDGTYRSKYWFPGSGFDSGSNLQPCFPSEFF